MTLKTIPEVFEDLSKTKNAEIKLKLSFLSRLLIKLNDFLNFEFFMNMMLAIEMDILLGAFVGIKYANLESLAQIYSLFVCIIVVLAYGFISGFLFWKIVL